MHTTDAFLTRSAPVAGIAANEEDLAALGLAARIVMVGVAVSRAARAAES